MPDVIPPTGLHAPITNIPPTESTVTAPELSPGSVGTGDVLELEPDAVSEAVSVPELGFESGTELELPDISELEDIGVASFGEPPRFESRIGGTDERVRITDTTKYPWRVLASLIITAADNSQWVGTGWFISPRTLVTAGHCVYIKNNEIPGRNGWVKKIQVVPGRNGTVAPFGGLSSTEFWTVKGWGERGLENYDYAAIILPSAFPQDLGHFGFGVFDDDKLSASVANVAGYPVDKPSGTLWYDSRQVGSVTPDKVYYAADTEGGQSGTVVYIVDEGQRVGIAIHAYGGRTANSGTRISSQVYANLQIWKRS